jgi:hypothetical protein
MLFNIMQLVVATWQWYGLMGWKGHFFYGAVAQFQAGSPQLLPRDGVALQWVAQDLRIATFHTHNYGEPVRQGKMVLLRVFKQVCSNRCMYACLCICTCEHARTHVHTLHTHTHSAK